MNTNPDGACCNPETELLRKQKFDADIAGAKGVVTPLCQALHKKIICGPCEPWSSHLYAALGKKLGQENGMMLSQGFCRRYYRACGASLGLPATFCRGRTEKPDPYYAYPFSQAAVAITDPTKAAQSAYPNLVGKYPDMMSGLVMRPDLPAWWILDQTGSLWEIEAVPDVKEIIPIMDITNKVLVGGEMGLVGLVFHPNFGNNRRFYLNYVSLDPLQHTIISQFTWVPGDLQGTRDSELIMFTWYQPETNHNGGWMGFSPLDMANPLAVQHELFIAQGDGGGANDMHWPQEKGELGNSQDLTVIYGKMLRVTIPANDALRLPGKLYTIPADNPFADGVGGLPEIYAWGLRNPWRCSFDSLTGDLWCADVGESRIEEFNIITLGGNYGWRMFEGTRCNTDTGMPNPCTLNYTAPVWQYCHEDFSLQPEANETALSTSICNSSEVMGQSVTGGFVYRGELHAEELGGQYVFADFETNVMGRLQLDNATGLWQGYKVADGTNGISYTSSFAEHFFTKELYVVSYAPKGNVQMLYIGDLKNATAAAAAAQPSGTAAAPRTAAKPRATAKPAAKPRTAAKPAAKPTAKPRTAAKPRPVAVPLGNVPT